MRGKRIVITRADEGGQAAETAAKIQARGGIPVLFPTIQLAPITPNPALDSALQEIASLKDSVWLVFTSANGVQFTLARCAALGLDSAALRRHRIAAIGLVTAQALTACGLQAALVPEEHVAEALAAKIETHGAPILLFQAEAARPVLVDMLRANGAHVNPIAVYQTRRAVPPPEAYDALRAGIDALTFTSASTVRFFCDLLGEEAREIAAKAVVACIGPITAQAAQDCGLPVTISARPYTMDGLLNALTEYFDS